jgi:hypothetical protein
MIALRRVVFGDWQLKLLGLVIAAGLWIYVHGEQGIQLTYSVPLELRNTPHSQKFSRQPPATVEVLLDVRREQLSKLNPGALRAVVDLAAIKGRRVELTLTPDHILRPDGVRVLSIAPSQLVLEFESVH